MPFGGLRLCTRRRRPTLPCPPSPFLPPRPAGAGSVPGAGALQLPQWCRCACQRPQKPKVCRPDPSPVVARPPVLPLTRPPTHPEPHLCPLAHPTSRPITPPSNPPHPAPQMVNVSREGEQPRDLWAAQEDMRLFCPDIADKHGRPRERPFGAACWGERPFGVRAGPAGRARPRTPHFARAETVLPSLGPLPCTRLPSALRPAAQVVRPGAQPRGPRLWHRPRLHLPHLAAPH